MEGHRDAKLLIRAAATGVVDFSKADLAAPEWHLHVSTLLDGFAGLIKLEHTKMKLQRHWILMGIPHIEAQMFSNTSEEEIDTFNGYIAQLHGGDSVIQREHNRMQRELKDAWENEFGKLDDPETIKKIDDTVEALRTRRDTA